MTSGNDHNGKHDKWEFSGLNTVRVGTIYTFPEFIFRNHMSLENQAIHRKSISDERK